MAEEEPGSWLDSYVVEHTTGEDGSASLAVVEAIAEATGTDPLDLAPLYEVVDPDALDQLVASADDRSSTLEVMFLYGGYGVTVVSNGRVIVEYRLDNPGDDTVGSETA